MQSESVQTSTAELQTISASCGAVLDRIRNQADRYRAAEADIRQRHASGEDICSQCHEGTLPCQSGGGKGGGRVNIECPIRHRHCDWSRHQEHAALLRRGFGREHVIATVEFIIDTAARETMEWYLYDIATRTSDMRTQMWIQASIGWGKTSLLRLIAGECLHANLGCPYLQATDLFERLNQPDWKATASMYQYDPFLLVDDLGDNDARWLWERFKMLVDLRYKRRVPTCVATYLSDPMLRKLPPPAQAALDRLRDASRTVEIIASGKSRRGETVRSSAIDRTSTPEGTTSCPQP